MRKTLVLVLILAALVVMPRDRPVTPGIAVDPPAASPIPSPPAPAATPAVLPVVYFGDSVTMGAFASETENIFVVRVDNDLRARGVDARNDTVWSFDPYSDLVNARAIASEHRKLIIVELGVHWGEFDDREFREIYGAMLDCLAGSGARIVVGTIPWLNWQPGNPLYFQMAFHSQIVREEAAKRGIAVADLWAATEGRSDAISRPGEPCFPAGACEGDNYHPSDTGHALIAEAYSRALDITLANPPAPQTDRCELDPYIDALANGGPIPLNTP